MFGVFEICAVAGTFLLAGVIKGVIGLGLPVVSLAILTVVFDLTSAMALLLAPSFVTNLWQALAGQGGRTILLRIWPFLLMMVTTVWIGVAALTRVDLSLLSALLGALLVVYSSVNLAGFRLTVKPNQEPWIGLLAGSANGILTGMTGSFVVPGVMYIEAIGLAKDTLIQAMGILFTLSTIMLAFALQQSGILTLDFGVLSASAVAPAAIGMIIGQRIRRSLSKRLFWRAFFISLLIMGGYIILSATTVV